MTIYSVPCLDCNGHHHGTCASAIRKNIYAAVSLAMAILILSIAIAGSIQ